VRRCWPGSGLSAGGRGGPRYGGLQAENAVEQHRDDVARLEDVERRVDPALILLDDLLDLACEIAARHAFGDRLVEPRRDDRLQDLARLVERLAARARASHRRVAAG